MPPLESVKKIVYVSTMPTIEEEVKERNELKSLTPNKLLTKIPLLLAQIKVGNNSYPNGIKRCNGVSLYIPVTLQLHLK